MEVVEGLPKKADFDKYLSVLEKTVAFVNGHRFYVDLNLCFGLFLINVNLRTAVKIRKNRIPKYNRLRLEKLLKTNDDIITYFFDMFRKHAAHLDPEFGTPIGVVDLYRNETAWINHLQTFNTRLLKKTKFTTKKHLERTYSKWPKYLKKVFDVNRSHYLSPEESDACLNLLAQNPVNFNMNLIHCQVPYSCSQLIQKGTNYGYEMTHRLLFLLAARFSRGCVLLSALEDRKITEKLCAKMFNEAEYIAQHDFKLPDLITQQISLCSLEGHSQFLQRAWLDELLELQISPGCFNLTKSEEAPTAFTIVEDVGWQFVKDDQILGGICNSHITSAAGIMVASALRYIMENFY
ncbi:unnamed protein product [Arctia plantaginis]|uniref:Uncharacterized protein n=1 Tax=Arctia plantaginis TaxID=874455 RepID=A0A8S1BKZ6_ARCPL|nr:unnamed protein product [Arctia plantaginis]